MINILTDQLITINVEVAVVGDAYGGQRGHERSHGGAEISFITSGLRPTWVTPPDMQVKPKTNKSLLLKTKVTQSWLG